MSGSKNEFASIFNWQTANPVLTFLPSNYYTGSPPSGEQIGPLIGTTPIYTNIVRMSKMDNQGIEVTWTGDIAGTFSVEASNSGINFYPLTFNPVIVQPAGSPGGFLVNLNQFPFTWVMLIYTNVTGTGNITAYSQYKSLS